MQKSNHLHCQNQSQIRRESLLHIICFAAGIACALYFIILLLYSGFTSAFYLVWPAMAVCFVILGWLFRIHFFARLPLMIRGVLLAFVVIGVLIFAGVEGMILRASVQAPAPGLDYAIVLGAHVRSTGPSRALALRLDAALDYANENPDTIFIVSGGQGSNEPCTEAIAMKTYLETHGLSSDRILMEDASTNTRENLIFSGKLIPEGTTVGIITNGFHVCRSLHLADTLGYKHVYGIPAKGDLITQPANLFREFFAVVKDYILIR